MEDSTLPIISSTFRTKRTNNNDNNNRRHKRGHLTNIGIGRSGQKRKSQSDEVVEKISETSWKKKKSEKEKEEVEGKIRALQRIVPGGESLGVDKLFEETAGYIMALQSQLKAMKTLANLFQGLHDEKRKFGG